MIPLKLSRRFYGKYKWFYRIVAKLLSFGFMIGMAYYHFIRLNEETQSGRDFSELRLEITHELLDSAAVGLERFYQQNGHYPTSQGKYFFDSIKQYIHANDVYVYNDSVSTENDTIPIKKKLGKFNFLDKSFCYFGIGTSEQTIIYKLVTTKSYKLYSVGENYRDENGSGDDIVYQRKKWYEIWK